MEVVEGVGRGINLDAPEDGQSLLNAGFASVDNVIDHDLLRIIECIGQLTHAIVRPCEALSEGQYQLLDGALLKVREALDPRVDPGGTVRDGLEVHRGGDCRSAAAVNEGDAESLDLADDPILGNTDVRSVDGEAVAVIGDVCSHGPPSGVSCEGEAG